MKSCTFDNPKTMSREVWQDGRLIVSYSATMMATRGAWPPPAKLFHMGANVGKWKKGQVIGDAGAIGKTAA
jgi:hypothetical protein